jgi:hypothetical protein
MVFVYKRMSKITHISHFSLQVNQEMGRNEWCLMNQNMEFILRFKPISLFILIQLILFFCFKI